MAEKQTQGMKKDKTENSKKESTTSKQQTIKKIDDAAAKNKHIVNEYAESSPYMTKYERARLLGERAEALSNGSRPLVDCSGVTDPLEIARLELLHGVLPFCIQRARSDGTYEIWQIRDFLPLDD